MSDPFEIEQLLSAAEDHQSELLGLRRQVVKEIAGVLEAVEQLVIDWDGIDDWPTTKEVTEKNVREISRLLRQSALTRRIEADERARESA